MGVENGGDRRENLALLRVNLDWSLLEQLKIIAIKNRISLTKLCNKILEKGAESESKKLAS
ncbi:MAG: hypothetical protein RLY43_1984 [Bacteroidota bacterium]|jgi:hypothetical protein